MEIQKESSNKSSKKRRKPKSKISYFLIVFLVLVMSTTVVLTGKTLISSNTEEVNKIEKAETVDQADGVEVIDLATNKKLANSKYTWSLKANKNTKVEFWNFDEGKLYNDTIIEANKGKWNPENFILPKSNDLSGKIGAWIYNVGTYEGKNINLKCTFYWENNKDGDEDLVPIIGIAPRATRPEKMIGFRFHNVSYKVKYEIFSGTGNTPSTEKMALDMSMTFGDIDGNQFFGFKALKDDDLGNGSIHLKQCVKGTNVHYQKDENDYEWFISQNPIPNSDIPEDSVRFELDNLHSFEIIYGAYNDTESYNHIDRITGDYAYATRVLGFYKDAFAKYKDKEVDADEAARMINGEDEWDIQDRATSWGYFTAQSYIPYDVPTIKKYVSDTDEKLKKSNTLSENEEFTYVLVQEVPFEQIAYYWKSYTLEDTLPSCVEYISTKVYDESGSNVTNKFNISISNQKLNITAKDTQPKGEGKNEVNDFYNSTYTFEVKVRLKSNSLSSFNVEENHYKFTNSAKVKVKMYDDTNKEKTSNEVESHYYTKKIEAIKTWSDNDNASSLRPENITLQVKKDENVVKSQTVTSDDEWKYTFENLPRYDAYKNEIIYTVDEANFVGLGSVYQKKISGTSITNKLINRKIRGTVFIDENKDNKKNTEDTLYQGITVELLDQNLQPVINTKGQTVGAITTDVAGAYEFKDLKQGNYIVRFTVPEIYSVIQKGVGTDEESSKANQEVLQSTGVILSVTDNLTKLSGVPADGEEELVLENINMGLVRRPKAKISIEKVDSETLNIIKDKEATFNVFMYDKLTGNYVQITNTPIRTAGTQDMYITPDWLYNTLRNEGRYYLIEAGTPEEYVGDYTSDWQKVRHDLIVNDSNDLQTVSIGNREENGRKIYINERTKGKIIVNKKDFESNLQEAQGDASIDGAVYGLYAKENIIHPDGVRGVLYARDELVDTATTQDGGVAIFENLYLGEYYIKEITPSKGYLLDENTYDVTLTYIDDRTEVVERSITSKEQVMKGPFTFSKGSVKSNTLLPGTSSSMQVLENAGFTAYLISNLSKVKDGTIEADVDGNYDVNDFIREYFNDETLTYDFRGEQAAIVYNETDENGKLEKIDGENKYVAKEMFSNKTGKVSSAELPYGKYIVVESTIPDNYPNEYFAAEPIIVTINEDSREEKLPDNNIFAVINYPFKAKIKINKMDSATKKEVLKVGAKYRIYNLDKNEYVTQIISYPDHVEFGTEDNPYAVNEKGELLTPETLEIGHYRLEEVEAPYGYVLQGHEAEEKEAVEFYIRKESDYIVDREDDKLYVIVKVKQENDPQVGRLTIIKEGEKAVERRNNSVFARMLRAVTGKEEKVEYSYERGGIEGAEFEVYVKETIYTPDNQREEDGSRVVNTYNGVKLEKDAKVIKVATNAEGKAIVEGLPLGSYYVKEVVAGHGYVINKEVKEVEFTYQGQEIAIVDKDMEYYNERQKAEITVEKIAEDTNEALEGAEFGLYIREGEEDNYNYLLIEKVVTGKDGKAKFSADVPLGTYYIMEIKAPNGYNKSEAIQKVNFIYQDQEITKQELKVTVTNELIQTPSKKVDIGDGTETKPGEVLTYTITYKNKTDRNEKIRITDKIPEGTKYMRGHVTATVKGKNVLNKGLKVTEPKDLSEGTTVVWEAEEFELKPGEIINVTYKVRVKTIEEGLEVDKVTNKANVLHGPDINIELIKDKYKVKYYKDNIVTGEFLGEEEYEAELGSKIDWEKIEKNLFKPEGYKDGELQEEESATIVIKGDGDVVYIVYKKEEPQIPEEIKDSYIVRYYKDSIDDKNILGEYRVEAKVDEEIPWNEIDVNLRRPEGYKDGELQEEISSNIVIKGEGDIVYILYLPERNDPKDSYTVKYYKDDIDSGEYLGSEKFEGFIGDAIEFEKVDTELKRPEGYSNGIIIEERSAVEIIVGDDDIVYVVYKKLPVEDETNEVENPIENPVKTVDKGNKETVMYGEELTYTIRYKNTTTGKERFEIRDSIPEGTKYIKGSMRTKINGENAKDRVEMIELENMADSGEVIWKSKEGVVLNPGDVIVVSFKVKVKEIEEGIEVDKITNKGKVLHGVGEVLTEEETNEVENPVKNPVKSVDIGNETKTGIGETLTYTVRYKNRSEEAEKVEIRDSIPKGTKYIVDSMTTTKEAEMIGLEDGATKGELRWNIEKLEAGEEVEVTFKVEVLEDVKVDKITNKAVVEHTGLASGKKITDETNEVRNPVEKPESPDTSDINIWLYVMVIFIAIIGIVVGVRIINTNKKKNKKAKK